MVGSRDIRRSVAERLSAPVLNCSYNIGEEAGYTRGWYCSGGRDSEGSRMTMVKNDTALTGVYFVPSKGLKLRYVVGPAADVFG